MPAGPVRSRDRTEAPQPARPTPSPRCSPRSPLTDCPMYPLERQAFLRAHALAALTEGHGTRSAHPRSSPSSTSPTPNPTAPPPSTGASRSSCPPRCCAACSTPPTSTRSWCAAGSCSTPPAGSTSAAPPGWPTGPNAAPCAPSTRTCAIPGCDTRYDLCKLHHIIWWEHGGRTDLDNLLPLCVRHHHDVHDSGWHLTLDQDRRLTITYPDGTSQSTGPPTRRRPGTGHRLAHPVPPPPRAPARELRSAPRLAGALRPWRPAAARRRPPPASQTVRR